MEKLLDYCLHYHYPAPANAENKVSHFFKMVCENVAKTTAQWMAIGFVHGVLNTDNINITGESFDYGPYRFLPYYNDAFTAAYFDHNGLYAYGQQPRVLLWNLEQLEKSLYLLQPDKKIYAAGYQTFETVFNQSTYRLFVQRLGVTPIRSESAGEKLCFAVIHFLKTSKMPFEHFFFDWYGGLQRQTQVLSGPHKNYYQSQAFQNVLEILKNFTPTDKNLPNYFDRQEPIYLYIDKIEQVWQHIDEKDDWDPLYNLLNEMQNIPRTLNI